MIRRFIPLLFVACGGASDAPDAGDAAVDHYGHKAFDAAAAQDVFEEPEAAAKVPWNRMTSHGGDVIASPKIRVLHVGVTKDWDAYVAWMLSSTTYWSILAQYGIGPGEYLGSVTVDQATFFQPDDIQGGFIDAFTLGIRIQQAIATLPPSDAGAAANAWIVFLPGGVNVDLDQGTTCQYALGYHWADGAEPYAVIPDCGGSGVTISHEIAEMVTDPTGGGWYSDDDVANAGGEIGDLCNLPVTVEGHVATLLWSNADGACEPQ